MVVLVSDATNFKPRVPQQSSSKPRIIKRFLTLAQAFFGKSICYPDILEIYGNLGIWGLQHNFGHILYGSGLDLFHLNGFFINDDKKGVLKSGGTQKA